MWVLHELIHINYLENIITCSKQSVLVILFFSLLSVYSVLCSLCHFLWEVFLGLWRLGYTTLSYLVCLLICFSPWTLFKNRGYIFHLYIPNPQNWARCVEGTHNCWMSKLMGFWRYVPPYGDLYRCNNSLPYWVSSNRS